jgi:hypothetical protein
MAKKRKTPLTRESIVRSIEGYKTIAKAALPGKRMKVLSLKLDVSPNGNVKPAFVVFEGKTTDSKVRTYSSIDFALKSYEDIL